MTDFEQLFSLPENRGEVMISGQPVQLFHCKVCIMGESKFFWRADYKGISIVTACDSMQECMTKAKRYLKRTT